MVIASIVGVWLFSIQHRFEHAQWMPDASWSFAEASLGGTSHLRLPRLLQWFTGNIGFHHVHHVNPRIPNYRLEECHNADAGFRSASTLTLRTGLQALGYALWDSDLERLVPSAFVCPGLNDGDCSLGSLLTRRWRKPDSNLYGVFPVKWLFSVYCQFFVRSGKGRSSSRRLRSGSRSARKGSRDRNASKAWRLAA